ncbi:putative glycosyltransferase - possibly involved in cell wall localization and side chain formation of rhamnose-glucose polysaccharide [Enterobacteriaceae bacterium bta3-1]|nr:putative glycosyltransferase - possibly involved in cell wall localization and side chain formation of rhamnose-glucose polysaccharide [Enterobacteriaceae bacterium bta3-1]
MLDITEQQIKSSWSENFTDIQVSICCITYNQESYITTAIESFLMQKTNFPFEIVISDDCSTDNTSGIIAKFAEKYPSIIKVIANDHNLGANDNFLNTFNHSSGEYLATCEGDDYWCDEYKLQKQFDAMSINKNVMFSFHPCLLHRGQKVTNSASYNKGNVVAFYGVADVLQSLNQFAPTSSYMFSRQIVLMLPRWFSNAPVGDLFLELYGMRNHSGLYLPWVMSVYRLEAIGSWSSGTQRKNDVYIQRHLSLIEHLEIASNDFPNARSAFSRKIAHIYLALAVRAIKYDDVNMFRSYLDSANKYHKYVSIKHVAFNFFKKIPQVIKYIINIKNMVSSK